MKIYILKTDIDNYRGCYLKKTLVDRKIFRKLNKGNELTLTPEIQLEYDKENTNPVGDICECYDDSNSNQDNKIFTTSSTTVDIGAGVSVTYDLNNLNDTGMPNSFSAGIVGGGVWYNNTTVIHL